MHAFVSECQRHYLFPDSTKRNHCARDIIHNICKFRYRQRPPSARPAGRGVAATLLLEYRVTLDADNEDRPRRIKKLNRPTRSEDADIRQRNPLGRFGGLQLGKLFRKACVPCLQTFTSFPTCKCTLRNRSNYKTFFQIVREVKHVSIFSMFTFHVCGRIPVTEIMHTI